jgi:hypothetical protein
VGLQIIVRAKRPVGSGRDEQDVEVVAVPDFGELHLVLPPPRIDEVGWPQELAFQEFVQEFIGGRMAWPVLLCGLGDGVDIFVVMLADRLNGFRLFRGK